MYLGIINKPKGVRIHVKISLIVREIPAEVILDSAIEYLCLPVRMWKKRRSIHVFDVDSLKNGEETFLNDMTYIIRHTLYQRIIRKGLVSAKIA